MVTACSSQRRVGCLRRPPPWRRYGSGHRGRVAESRWPSRVLGVIWSMICCNTPICTSAATRIRAARVEAGELVLEVVPRQAERLGPGVVTGAEAPQGPEEPVEVATERAWITLSMLNVATRRG